VGRNPLKLLALFVLLSGIPLVALGWLGWRVVQQDRALETQRVREQLDNAATLVTRELDRGLTAWEAMLAIGGVGQPVMLPPDAVFLLITADGVAQHQGVALPYYPHVPVAAGPLPAAFAAAEAHEFRTQDLSAAIAAYRALADSDHKSIRAAALMRLARGLRKQARTNDALAIYGYLAALGDVAVAGSPAELVARRERIALFTADGDVTAAARERTLLTSALNDGRFRIDRPTFEYFLEFASVTAAAPQAAALAQAVEAVWTSWHEQIAGRTGLTNHNGAFVTVWRKMPNGVATITARVDALMLPLRERLEALPVIVQLDDQGKTVWGRTAAEPRLTKSARETGLPWSLYLAAAESSRGLSVADSRRNLLIAGFALMAVVVFAAGYFVFRAVNRELAVARLQSDFVAAVSHEFRTPLTAMCHLTEMLEQGDTKPERLSDYYRALGKESRRLRSMVENLLDFGRMDSGRRTYDFCETDAAELVGQVAQEFTDRSAPAADRIEMAPLPASAALVRADREALGLALRNLVDNAMKYSPDSSSVRVAVTASNGTVAVSVEDHGPGVSADERRAIFRKFTRGAAARNLNVKGTGIGLTMANQIVKAHGGRLELDSEMGRGSTFTMVLPAIPR